MVSKSIVVQAANYHSLLRKDSHYDNNNNGQAFQKVAFFGLQEQIVRELKESQKESRWEPKTSNPIISLPREKSE